MKVELIKAKGGTGSEKIDKRNNFEKHYSLKT
jgi:hypothetical protein